CKTSFPFPRCMCPSTHLNDGKLYEGRTTQQTSEIRDKSIRKFSTVQTGLCENGSEKHRTGSQIATTLLREKSLSTCRSYFEETNLFIQDNENNVYWSIGFEAMHNLDLGISKELKNCLFRRLGSERLTCKGREFNGRIYKSIRTAIFRAANEMFKQIQEESYVSGLHVDFSSKNCSSSLNGLFTQDGVTGMLEAKNMRCIDYIFPFVACFIDRICGELWGPSTTISVLYIDIVKMIFELEETAEWRYEDMDRMKGYITHFQEVVKLVFSSFQPSTFNTLKFHFLAHIIDDLCRYGDLRMLEVRFYEI
ncbi:MAG: hypothetical protein AAGH46_09760, partial [Bacteroidota bacterium]